jgi:hypothetical protein
MKTLDVGPLPVCDGDRLVGMITDRDITVRAVAQGFGGAMGRVKDVMTPDVVGPHRRFDTPATASQSSPYPRRYSQGPFVSSRSLLPRR